MGIIAEQSFKKSIILYVGVLIGTVSTLFIYPLQLETYGSIQFLIATSSFFLPLLTLGISSLTIRFFPEFNAPERNNNGFLGLLILTSFLAAALMGILIYLLRSYLIEGIEWMGMKSELIQKHILKIAIFVLISIIITLCTSYLTNFKRIVIPSLIGSFPKKIIVPVLVLFTYYSVFSLEEVQWLLVVAYFFMGVGMLLYVRHLGVLDLKPNLSFLEKPLMKRMTVYSFYGILLTMGSVLTYRIDVIMLATMVDLKNTGIYTIALFISNVMLIPSKSLNPILSAQISDFFYKDAKESILTAYQKSSLIPFILGVFVFIIFWFNLEDFISFFSRSDDILTGKNAIFFLVVAKLIGMLFGFNSPIIAHSNYFKVNVFFIFILGIVTVVSNLYFIPILGLEGAALATLISIFIFNFSKFVFIWIKLEMQPFTLNTLFVFLLGGMTWGILSFIPDFSFPMINILFKSLLVVILFMLPIYGLKISPDLNDLVRSSIRKVLRVLKKS